LELNAETQDAPEETCKTTEVEIPDATPEVEIDSGSTKAEYIKDLNIYFLIIDQP
jgi:hypothetical protein